MRIAILGATGFIGAACTRHFKQKWYKIYSFWRTTNPHTSLQKISTYTARDINQSLWQKIECDILIHAAASTSLTENLDTMIKNNVSSRNNIQDSFKWLKHIVYISSSSVYQGLEGEIDESILIDEKNLTNPYAKSKYLAEKKILSTSDTKTTILRPRAIYGVGDRVLLYTALNKLFLWKPILIGNWKYKTSLTHINTLIQAIDLTINNQQKTNMIYNVADQKSYSYAEVYNKIAKEFLDTTPIHIPLWCAKPLCDQKLFWFNDYVRDIFTKDKILDIWKLKKLGRIWNQDFMEKITEIKMRVWKIWWIKEFLMNYNNLPRMI